MTKEEGYINLPLRSLKEANLRIDVVLFQQKLSVKKILGLKTGSLLSFDVPVGSSAYLSWNGHKFGTGKVVQVNENYGLEVIEILQ